MGIQAEYYAVSNDMLKLYHSNETDVDKFYGELEKLENTIHYCDLEKLFDVLHYFCAGCTSNSYLAPKSLTLLEKFKHIFGNLPKSTQDKPTQDRHTQKQKQLYAAFFGNSIPAGEHSFNDSADVVQIAQCLQDIDMVQILQNIDYGAMPFDELYPRLSPDDFDDELIEEYINSFEKFNTFYQTASKNGRSVFILIG